jgi:RHS repeat-associated protein
VHFEIPVFSKPGRGTSFDYTLSVDTSIWSPQGGVWTPTDGWGWRNISEVETGYLTRDSTNEECGLISTELSAQLITTKPRFFNFKYHDRFGVIHSFANTAGGCPGDGIDNVSTSQDASGDVLDTTTTGKWTIITPDGHSFKPPIGSTAGAGTYTDRNGNQISTSGSTFTDTLGMTALTVSGTAPSPTVFTYTTSSGTPASVTMNYTSYTVQTAFGCAGIAEYPATSVNLVSSVVLPDGSSYLFQYEPTPGHAGSVTGRISEITLRTGGNIQYVYSGGSNGIECSDGSTAGFDRTTMDGTSSYSRSGSGSTWATTILDAATPRNQTAISFQTAGVPVNFYETHRIVNQGTSTVLIQTDTCYNAASQPNCSTTPIALPISDMRKYTILNNGQQALTDTHLDDSGLISELDEYDFGSIPQGSLIRKTITTYAALDNGIIGLPASITIQDGSGNQRAQQTFGYDEAGLATTSGVPQHIAVIGSRGNLTTLSQWVDAAPTTLVSTYTYDDTGDMLTSKDPAGNQTLLSYADNFSDGINRNTLAYLTQTTLPSTGSPSVSHVSKTKYDPNTGLQTATWDLNNNQTTYTYDSLLRILQLNYPDGGQTTYSYSSPTSISENITLSASQTLSEATLLDGLGRFSQRQVTSDPAGTTMTDAGYDANGLFASISNPHRATSASTDGTIQMKYDALGRIVSLTQADGNIIQQTYSNSCITATDEASKVRMTCVDALGRTTSTFEPDATGALNWETDTTYDALNDTTRITQKGGADSSQWRVSTYSYDGFARLTQMVTPESGTTNLFYTTVSGTLCAGNPGSKCRTTDSRSITTTFSYDPLSRLTAKAYSDSTSPVSYLYDQASFNGLAITNGNGARTGMTDGSGSTAWSFDAMRRVKTRQQTIASVTKSIGYTYNLDGSIASMVYPSGRVYSYGYNNAGQATSIVDSVHNINFLTNAQYAPPGLLTGAVHGATVGWNAITLANTYNNRLQPTQFKATSPVPSTLLDLSYSYDQGGGKNNGDVVQIANGRDSSRTVAYTYDQVNRLSSAETPSAPTWGDSYGYDPWGNLLQKNVIKGTAESMTLTVGTNNHVTTPAFTYDAAGNVTSDTSVSMTYDAEGHMNPITGTHYTYDGDGRRVLKSDGTIYWVDDSLRPLSIGTTSGSLTKDFVFLDSKRIAFVSLASGNPYYYLSDHLGSTAVIGSGDGKTIQWEADYFPFGSERQVFTSSVNNSYRFTGYEFDSDTMYNYANARVDAGRWGRFLSPDPDLDSINVSNPQSVNRYSYVLNNPVNMVDPLGLFSSVPCGGDGIPVFDEDDRFTGICLVGYDGSSGGGVHEINVVDGGGGGGGKPSPNKKAKKCAKKIQDSVQNNLKPTSVTNLGPTSGPGMDSSGMRGGAYNINLFVTGVNFGPPGQPGATGAPCGRFPDGLHIPNPGEPGCPELHDPTILGPTTMNGVSGFQFTAHIDSGNANTFLGAAWHLIMDVILGNLGVHHGC